jgi:hypothetical protein
MPREFYQTTGSLNVQGFHCFYKHFWNMKSQDFEFLICSSKVEQLMNDHLR